MKDSPIVVFNPAVSDQSLVDILSYNKGSPEGRARARAYQDLRQQLISPTFNYSKEAVDQASRDSQIKFLQSEALNDYKRGYNDAAASINANGPAWLWNNLNLDSIPDETAYQKGTRYAIIQYRASWPYRAPKKSTWDEVWDTVKTGLELGLEIVKVAVL